MTNQKDSEKNERRTKAKVTPISSGSSQSENTDHHMDRLATAFESSAHRWELMVYPSLFAFIILASYGFFLIYSLTTDIAHMSRNISETLSSICCCSFSVACPLASTRTEAISNVGGSSEILIVVCSSSIWVTSFCWISW